MNPPSACPRDTTPEAFQAEIRALRERGLQGRASMAFELSDNLRAITQAGIRRRHPEYDEVTVRRELVRLTAGEDVARLLPARTPQGS